MKKETIYIKDRLHEADNVGTTKINKLALKLKQIIADANEDITYMTFRKFEMKQFELYQNKINQALEQDLRQNATPPIKGEINKGKLKWRGIALTVSPEGQYLTQRGERISKII